MSEQELHHHNNVSFQEHIAIFNAIRDRDPDEADRALQTHLKSVSATWRALGKTKNPLNDPCFAIGLVNSIAQ